MQSFLDLKENFGDPEYRQAYAEDYLNTWVATQIQVLREQRDLSQEEFAELIGTQQPGVSRLENVNHSSWKTETLKKIANALGVRLKISFETYGTLLYEATSFSRDYLERPTFDKDPVFTGELTVKDIGISAGDPNVISASKMAQGQKGNALKQQEDGNGVGQSMAAAGGM
jgi:transcriptional regulator with XRE-family HTH domain